jgi:cysteine sulfinate desulfinase/cysteine desulfurase-like protein
MGVPREVALGALRFSLGRTTTRAEIVEAAGRIAAAIGANATVQRAV